MTEGRLYFVNCIPIRTKTGATVYPLRILIKETLHSPSSLVQISRCLTQGVWHKYTKRQHAWTHATHYVNSGTACGAWQGQGKKGATTQSLNYTVLTNGLHTCYSSFNSHFQLTEIINRRAQEAVIHQHLLLDLFSVLL